MKIKRSWCMVIITFLLLWPLPLPVLGAPGDGVFFDQQWGRENISVNNLLKQDAVFSNNKIYVLYSTQIYQYTIGEETPALVADFLPGKANNDFHFTTFEEGEKVLGEEAQWLIGQLFMWKDHLYGLNLFTGKAFLVDENRGALVKDSPIVLDWDTIEDQQNREDGYYVEKKVAGVIRDELFILTSTYTGQSPRQALTSFNLINGDGKKYETTNIQRLIDYKEGRFLAIVYDEGNSYDQQAQKHIYPKVMVFTPHDDILTPFIELPNDGFGGFAYNQKEDSLYYSAKGRIFKQKPNEKETEAGHVNAVDLSYKDKAWITDDMVYVASKKHLGEVYVKNISPQYANEKPLTLYGFFQDEILQKFQSNYPDIPIIMAPSVENTQDILKAIQTGSSNIDIIAASPERLNFKYIKEKEYALPLSKSTFIKENLGRMYPFIQKGLTHQGEIYAIPLNIAMSTTLSYSLEAFEAVGLTKADVPGTYVEYLDLFKRWYEDLAEKNPDYAFFDYPVDKSWLSREVIAAYTDIAIKKGEPIDFDTPLFRKIIAKVDQAFENINPDEWVNGGEDEGGYEKPTLFLHISGNVLSWEEEYKPLILRLDEGVEEAVQAGMDVVFINPNSQNQEGAIRFLETAMELYPPKDQLMYYADGKEPYAFEHFDAWVKDLEDKLAENKKRLELVQGQEKKETEISIENIEKALSHKESRRWEVSPNALKEYETIVPAFFIPTEELLYSQDEDSNIYRLFGYYREGAITLDEFITKANQRIEMAVFENQ